MRLRPVTLVVTFVLGLLAGPLPAEAQQQGKVYRIGWLSGFFSPASDPGQIPFRQGLAELGYVEGQNLVIEYRYRKGQKVGQRLFDVAAPLAAELARLSGFDPLGNFFRVISSEFPRRGEPEMGLNGL